MLPSPSPHPDLVLHLVIGGLLAVAGPLMTVSMLLSAVLLDLPGVLVSGFCAVTAYAGLAMLLADAGVDRGTGAPWPPRPGGPTGPGGPTAPPR
jgi:hypothetical protein